MQTILFNDGQFRRLQVFVYAGACLIGQPTAYTYRDGQFVWLRRGESASWIEA